MKKLAIGTSIGMTLAIGCGLAGLHSLSATVVVTTAFFGGQAAIVVALDALSDGVRRVRT